MFKVTSIHCICLLNLIMKLHPWYCSVQSWSSKSCSFIPLGWPNTVCIWIKFIHWWLLKYLCNLLKVENLVCARNGFGKKVNGILCKSGFCYFPSWNLPPFPTSGNVSPFPTLSLVKQMQQVGSIRHWWLHTWQLESAKCRTDFVKNKKQKQKNKWSPVQV